MNMDLIRAKALAFGKVAAEKQFAGRKGHGGNPDLAERHLTKQQIEVLMAAAFEAGAALGNTELSKQIGNLKVEKSALAEGLRRIATDTKGFERISLRGVYHQIATEALIKGGEVV